MVVHRRELCIVESTSAFETAFENTQGTPFKNAQSNRSTHVHMCSIYTCAVIIFSINTYFSLKIRISTRNYFVDITYSLTSPSTQIIVTKAEN